jgi:nucleoside-diphosphate-sugar epimerase
MARTATSASTDRGWQKRRSCARPAIAHDAPARGYAERVTYFVTGATGFVGAAVVRELRRAGHQVRALVRAPARASALAGQGVEIHPGDVTDKETMRRPMTGVDGVFHLAGWYKIGVRDPDTAVRVNVDGTRHVVELMQELRVPRGVYTSTLAVNSDTHGRVVDESYRFAGRHLSLYDRTKAEAHRIAESFAARGVPLVIVQPGVVYGPGDRSSMGEVFLSYLRRRLPAIPRRAAFAWGFVDDVARGHLLAMEKGQAGRNYFLCGPIHTLAEALGMAARITGIRAPRLTVGSSVLRSLAVVMALVERVVNVPPAYTAEGLRVAGATYLGSNRLARRELGWRVRPLQDGLIETLRYEMTALGMSPRF